jgi:hypothetical protein
MPWAHSDPLQSFFWFPSTFKIFNNLGNLLFAAKVAAPPGEAGPEPDDDGPNDDPSSAIRLAA